jgi:hypothetical protein
MRPSHLEDAADRQDDRPSVEGDSIDALVHHDGLRRDLPVNLESTRRDTGEATHPLGDGGLAHDRGERDAVVHGVLGEATDDELGVAGLPGAHEAADQGVVPRCGVVGRGHARERSERGVPSAELG